MSKCICALGKRGRISQEWNDGTRDRLYCYGKSDRRTDELMPECEACLDNVNKAQEDMDLFFKPDVRQDRPYADPAQLVEQAASIKADTITSSRFTPEEREAIETLIKHTVGRGMDAQTYDALLTVRGMLQEVKP